MAESEHQDQRALEGGGEQAQARLRAAIVRGVAVRLEADVTRKLHWHGIAVALTVAGWVMV